MPEGNALDLGNNNAEVEKAKADMKRIEEELTAIIENGGITVPIAKSWVLKFEGDYLKAVTDAKFLKAGQDFFKDTPLSNWYWRMVRKAAEEVLGKFKNPQEK